MSDSWEYERMETFVRDDYTCQGCGDVGGSEGEAELIAHKEDSTLVTLCRSCHRGRIVESGVSEVSGEQDTRSSSSSTTTTTSTDRSSTSSGSENDLSQASDGDERVMFFPSRREIVIDEPSPDTKGVMSQASHLVDSTDTGYMYKIDEEDVWNFPYDSFDGLKQDLVSVVNSWDGGFESRIRDDWERANQFKLKTRVNDGNRFSVLEADDSDVFENVAKRKLEYNDHYVEFLSDTELRVKKGADGSVKEVLYEEGYPVIDERELDEGESLSIELDSSIELREYQSEWVGQFSERKSGVFVGPPGSGKTVAAIGVMCDVGGETLIIVPSQELAQQWEEEIVDKTSVPKRKIGQYHGNEKRVRPITIATYDIVSMSRHREIFKDREWGLVLADECLSGDTEVVTKDGRKSFREIDLEYGVEEGWNDIDIDAVRTYDPTEGFTYTRVSGIFKTKSTVNEIHTSDGDVFKATSNHTHLIYNPSTGSIEETTDVSEGDYLLKPKPETPDSVQFDSELELLGWIIGDGSITESHSVKFSFSKDKSEQAKIIKTLCDEINIGYSEYHNSRGDVTIRIPKKDAEKLPIDYIGTGSKARTVRVPEGIYTKDSSSKLSILRGLFDAEGWVSEGRIHFGSASKGLSDDVCSLLRDLGFFLHADENRFGG